MSRPRPWLWQVPRWPRLLGVAVATLVLASLLLPARLNPLLGVLLRQDAALAPVMSRAWGEIASGPSRWPGRRVSARDGVTGSDGFT